MPETDSELDKTWGQRHLLNRYQRQPIIEKLGEWSRRECLADRELSSPLLLGVLFGNATAQERQQLLLSVGLQDDP